MENFKSDLSNNLRKLAGVKAVGDYWFGFDPKSKPAGVQLFAGQLLSRSSYQVHSDMVFGGKRTVLSEDEWQAYVSQNGFCPFYSSGDGSTTYRMPLIKGVHPEFVSALIDAGQYKEAGLPNITGYAGALTTGISTTNWGVGGAFYQRSQVSQYLTGAIGSGYLWGMDASLSNPIYGNSDTVQPPSLTFLIGEYVISSVANIDEADKNNLLEMINQLENKTSNMVKSVNDVFPDSNGNIDVLSLMMPDYSAGVAISSGYTAPSSGIVVPAFVADGNGAAYLYINGIEVGFMQSGGSYDAVVLFGEYWVSKGDKVTFSIDPNVYKSDCKFYPLKGA